MVICLIFIFLLLEIMYIVIILVILGWWCVSILAYYGLGGNVLSLKGEDVKILWVGEGKVLFYGL